MTSETIPPILKLIIEEGQRPRSEKEHAAAHLFVLGKSTVEQYMNVLHEEKHRIRTVSSPE